MSKHGLIIIGYPGIGKTSVANIDRPYSKIIDLDYSNFTISYEKIENWYVIYSKTAVELASQGFIVLVSSHDEVQDELQRQIEICSVNQDDISVVSISPDRSLKNKWIMKLHDRYLEDATHSNKKALERAEQYYTSDIFALASNSNFSHIYLKDMNYDLFRIIMSLRDIYCEGQRRGISC